MIRADTEVVVVGGGPAGASTAALLAAQGREVVLLERGTVPRQKPCGEYYGPGVVDALSRLGALDRVLSREHSRPPGMRISARGSSLLLDYPDREGGRRALGIRRYHLDNALLEHARSAGVEVRTRTRVAGISRDAGGRVAGVRIGRGGDRSGGEISARFVVGADGRHSVVSRGLGLDLPTRWPRRLGLHAHFELPDPLANGCSEVEPAATHPLDLDSGRGEMHVGEYGAYCGLGPVGGNLVVAGLVTPLGDKRSGERAEDYFNRRLEDVPGAAHSLRKARRVGPVLGVGPLARRVGRVCGPGYLLVGDAAGYLDPFTGEGVFRALRGAELAAWSVEQGLRSGSDSPVDYETSRQRVFSDKERLTWLVQLLLSRPPLLGYALDRMDKRADRSDRIKVSLGDYGPARAALNPGYLAALLAP